MPIYEYRCKACEHQFDLRQGFDAAPLAQCPKCDQKATRQFAPVAVHYKGSGFYTTDYKRTTVPREDRGGSRAELPEKSPPSPPAEQTNKSD